MHAHSLKARSRDLHGSRSPAVGAATVTRTELTVWAPPLVVSAWLACVACECWYHASRSVQTPWGDAISYLLKASTFWTAIDEGRWFNPFNLGPSIRPPGTILMSYPLGMSADCHGFYFRSVYLPIVSTTAAVYIAAGRRAIVCAPWTVASIALLLASLPMFYWFEWNTRWTNNGFGMVDNFQAGIAALAAAAMVRSLVDRSVGWQFISTLLFCFTFTIKQSGLMLMGSMLLVWSVLVFAEARRLRKSDGSTLVLTRYARASGSLIVAYFALFIVAATCSIYLSSDNFDWAVRALGFYRRVADGLAWLIFHCSLGEVLLACIVATIGVALCATPIVRGEPLATGLAVGGLVVWGLGLWYWLVPQGGGIQIRYFHPFALMGLVLAVPFAIIVWKRSHRVIGALGFGVCVVSAGNIAVLLAAGDHPSDRWQWVTGVNVSIGDGLDEVRAANAFLQQVRQHGADVNVYYFPGPPPAHYFVNAGVYDKIMHPRLPSFLPRDPMDWGRGFAVRTRELVGSRYVLNRKYTPDEAAAALAPATMDTFAREVAAFDAHVSSLDERAGLKLVLDGDHVRLSEVTDPAVFAQSIATLVDHHGWRREFADANRPGASE